MFSLIKKIIYGYCFCILLTNSYGSAAAADPSNFKLSPPSIGRQIAGYNASITEWLNTHDEGRKFLDSGYKFPTTMDEFADGGNKPLEAYKAFYATQKAQKDGAGGKLGSTLRPTLQAGLGLQDEVFDRSAEEVMQHVATALASQKEKADREQDAQRRLAEEQSAKARALQDVDASQREKEILERQAEEQQSARRVLEVQHMALRVHAGEAGIDVGEIERGIAERLERMQEENALNTALDSLRFLTHFAQRQADISDPLAQIRKLNERSKAFERALESRSILEKDELILPIGMYFDIPFFAVYDKKFDTPEFKALQAWQVLQTSTKLSPADLSKIKDWATLKQKAKPDDKDKKAIETLGTEVSAYLDKIEKDLLWQALKTAIPLYFDEVYFWSRISKMHEFNKGAFVNIKVATDAYADFSTAEKLKLLDNDRLKSIAFKISAVRQELSPASTAAANFALFDDLDKSFKELIGQLGTYNTAVAAGRFANIPHVEKLTKLRLGDIPGTLSIEGIHGMPNAVFARTLRTLESLSFCIKDTDQDATSFVTLSATSGKLLATVSSFIDQLQQYATQYYTKVTAALVGSGPDVLRDVRVLGYERPKFEEEKVEPPVTLKKCLAPVLEESAVEKEVKAIDRQIEKIRTEIQTQSELKKNRVDFEKIIDLLKTHEAFLKSNFSGAISPFAQFKKLPNKPDAAIAIPIEIFNLFELLGQNLGLLDKVLSSGVVNLDSNYKENSTLTKKDILDCVSDFAKKLPESREVIIKVKDGRPEAATIHVLPFFYYLCFELNNSLQAELKKIGASNLEKVLPHLDGLSNTLKSTQDRAEIKGILTTHNFFKDIEAAKKIKFKTGSLVQLRIKSVDKDMKVEDFFKLLPQLITAYTAEPPASSPPVLSRVHTPPAVIGMNAPPPPPLNPPAPPPPPPPPSRSGIGSATPVLGKDITVNDLITSLDFLYANLVGMAIGPDDQIRDLEALKAQKISEITRERNAYATLTSGTWDQGAYDFLTGVSNQVLIKYFRGIDCGKYLNTKDNSDGFIEKLYNEFMQSVEFILWNKIAGFGKATTERLLAAAGASVVAEKQEFIRTFGDTTLNDLVRRKLVKTDKANEIASKVLPEPRFKHRQQKYAETFSGIDILASTVFPQIIDKYVADLQAKKAASASGRVHHVSFSGDVFADALRKLKKSQDIKYTQAKQKIDKLLVEFAKQYDGLKGDQDVLRKIDAYVAAFKIQSADLKKLTQELDIGLHGSNISEIAYHGTLYKNGAVITNIIYDFFKLIVDEFVSGNAPLGQELSRLNIDDDGARKTFTERYMDGGKVEQFTVINVLNSEQRIVPLSFQGAYSILASRGDGSQFDFAAHVVKEFLDKFPAFLTEQVNARLYADDVAPQQLGGGPAHQQGASSSSSASQQSDVDGGATYKENLVKASIPFAEKHAQLDTARPADIDDQKVQIVFDFLENTGIIDRSYLDYVKRAYQAELVRIRGMKINDTGILRTEYEALQSSAADALEKNDLAELLKQKHADIRVVELLKLYADNPQKIALEVLKNIQQGKNKFKLIERLDKFAKGKTFWLENQMDGLCVKGTKIFDFSRILSDIEAMPQDQFLDNFFGTVAQ